jgi:penicillin-binding protein 2
VQPAPGRWVDLYGAPPRPRWTARLVGVVVVLALLTGVLEVRLAQLQVAQGGHLSAVAEQNRVHRLVLEADRGIIYDRHGTQLVVNQASWRLELVPAALPVDAGRRAAEISMVARLGGIAEPQLRQLLARAPDLYLPVLLKDGLDHKQALVFQERLPELPGVQLTPRTFRLYTDPLTFAHVIGYTGRIDPDEYRLLRRQGYRADGSIGKTGLEAGLEAELRGSDGWADVEASSRGELVRTLASQEPLAGRDVYLSIDSGLQRAVRDYLEAGIRAARVRAGAALVVDPQTGEVLSLVSLPSFDTNLFTRGISGADYQRLLQDPARPLNDRALAGLYPPGSTFKMVTAAAALQEGRINADTVLPCPAAITYGGWVYQNWAGYDMGRMDLVKAIAVSCDTYFYVAADRVGDVALGAYARAFGYGRSPGIEIPGAAAGLAPDRDWLQSTCPSGQTCTWNPGETLTMGIGQSYTLTTPLIQAMYVSAVANGGRLLEPTLVHQVRDPAGKQSRNTQPSLVQQVPVSAANLGVVKEGMRQCLQAPYGTGFLFRLDGFKYDGGCKTGTAQYGGSAETLPTHAWFTFFAPYAQPEIAIVVLVEGGGEGHEAAEPIAVRIADYYFAHRDQVRQ